MQEDAGVGSELYPCTRDASGGVFSKKECIVKLLAEYEEYSALSGGSPRSTGLCRVRACPIRSAEPGFSAYSSSSGRPSKAEVRARSFLRQSFTFGLGEKEQAFLWLEKSL